MNRQLIDAGVYNFCEVSGELLGQYEQKNDGYATNSNRHMRRVDNSMRVWFAGRLVKAGPSYEQKYTDRMGSVVAQNGLRASYYPYGEEVSTVANDGREKFATYRRDATGLDYSWNRMYAATYGRFLQADPYRASASMMNPHSWNRYAYVENDPVNANDPTGLCTINGQYYPDGIPPCPDGTTVTVNEQMEPWPGLSRFILIGAGIPWNTDGKPDAVAPDPDSQWAMQNLN